MAIDPARFRYHPNPTPEQALAYAAIRDAETHTRDVCLGAIKSHGAQADRAARIDAATLALATTVDTYVHAGPDRDAAVAHVEDARNAATEAVYVGESALVDDASLITILTTELLKARWKACRGVALSGDLRAG
jgi:hypothetical protein